MELNKKKSWSGLIDLHMRQTIDSSLLSDCQHAYTKGRPVETALRKLVCTLQYSRKLPIGNFPW